MKEQHSTNITVPFNAILWNLYDGARTGVCPGETGGNPAGKGEFFTAHSFEPESKPLLETKDKGAGPISTFLSKRS